VNFAPTVARLQSDQAAVVSVLVSLLDTLILLIA